jgi:hypothetical protein
MTKGQRCRGSGQKDQPPVPNQGLSDDADQVGQAQEAAVFILFNSGFLSFRLDRPAHEPWAAHARSTMELRCLPAIPSAQFMIWSC